MVAKFKARTPVLVAILLMMGVGYAVAQNRVLVLPLGGGGGEMPSGMVSAFNTQDCPAGWERYANLNGRTIVGATRLENIGYTQARSIADKTVVSDHYHRWGNWDSVSKDWIVYRLNGVNPPTSRATFRTIDWRNGIGDAGEGIFPLAFPGSPPATRNLTTLESVGGSSLPYVHLLYCVKT